jgi:RNA polymerase sigma factor (sigma-70 family)
MSAQRSKTRGPGRPTEATLFHQAQQGNRQALNRLMAQHDGLVQVILRRQGSGPLSYAEALQAGRIGLWRAICHFDPTLGFAFSTYAWTCIMRHIWRAVKGETRSAFSVLPMDLAGLRPTPDPALLLEPDPLPPMVHDLVHRLPPRLQQILHAYYGLDGDAPANFAQIGRTLGLSEERVRQLHQEALIWLRQPAHSQQLRSLLRRHTLADYQAIETLGRRWWRSDRGHHAA